MGRKQIELTGRKIGKLTVIEKIAGSYPRGCVPWKCVCDCGKEGVYKSRALLSNNRRSCGCLQAEVNKKNSFKDISGNKYGSLTVIKCLDVVCSGRDYLWECICDCGNTTKVSGCHLREKNGTRSCGCLINSKQKINVGKASPTWKGCENVPGSYFRRIIESAKRRNIELNITVSDINEVYLKQNKKCALTNLDVEFKRRNDSTASLDRIDSSKGYTIDNIQIVHKIINQIKLDLPQDEFIYYCKLVADKFKD